MNETFARQAHEMLDAATHARMPENVQAFAVEASTRAERAMRR